MRASANDHGAMKTTRGAARLISVVLAAVVVAAPVASALHELTVAHVTCAEHGELTHVAIAHGSGVAAVRGLATVEADTPESGTTDAHDHCSLGSAVRSGVCSPFARTAAVRYEPPAAVSRTKRVRAPAPGRAFVLASAPKTSPPSA
jgi:hypothetical protein